jgi:hypothetical protein
MAVKRRYEFAVPTMAKITYMAVCYDVNAHTASLHEQKDYVAQHVCMERNIGN